MPRPSLKAERTEAILDAIERCVIRDGVAGATLENIAKEANMRRSLLRHNVGNRDQLIEAFLTRFFEKSNIELNMMLEYLPSENTINVLLDYLFDEQYSNKHLSLVALALNTAAVNDESISRQLGKWNADFIYALSDELNKAYPDATKEDCHVVATGLVGIYFNAESLSVLKGLSELRDKSKLAAKALVNSLASYAKELV